MGNKVFSKEKCEGYLSGAIVRLNVHRSKKLTSIAKIKDTVCGHLYAMNEVNAKIWCATLINEERQVPCYDIASTMCDQVKGRLREIAKFGAIKDMNQTFATIIHIAPKLNVEELMKVRKQLKRIVSEEFAL